MAAYTGYQNEYRKLTKAERRAIGQAAAPAVVPAPPFGGLGKAAVFEVRTEEQTISSILARKHEADALELAQADIRLRS